MNFVGVRPQLNEWPDSKIQGCIRNHDSDAMDKGPYPCRVTDAVMMED